MLEKPEKRKITLVEVMNACRMEAICAKEDAKHEPQQLSPCSNCSVSTEFVICLVYDSNKHFGGGCVKHLTVSFKMKSGSFLLFLGGSYIIKIDISFNSFNNVLVVRDDSNSRL